MTVEEPQGLEEEGTGESEYTPSEFAQGILSQVAEEDRPYVEKYINQWDAGVSRRFADYNSQVKQYQELGDYDELSTIVGVLQDPTSNPQIARALYDYLSEEYGTAEPEETEIETPQGLSPEYLQKQTQLETIVTALAEQFLAQNQVAEQNQEDQELDEYLGLLKREFGDFDEDFVLAKMLAGLDGDKAVQAYQAAIQAQVNGAAQTSQLPAVLSSAGGAGMPGQVQGVSQLSRNDTRKLVADILSQAQQE